MTTLSLGVFSACTLPIGPQAQGSPSPKPSPSPSCTTSAPSGGKDVEGVSNPTGPSPQYFFRVTVPSSYTASTFSKLSKGVAMRTSDSSGSDAPFVNVAISTLRAGSLATSVKLKDEVDKERSSSVTDGYTVDSNQMDCTVAGAPAVVLNEKKTTGGTNKNIYELMFIGYLPDDLFGGQDAVTLQLIGGSNDADKDKMIQTVQAVAGSWQWENGATSTAEPASPTASSSPR